MIAHRRLLVLGGLIVMWLAACSEAADSSREASAGASRSDQGGASFVDRDGDGWSADVDCDDVDGAVHPGAAESCNQRDDDCDGYVDEDLDTIRLWPDADADEFGTGEPVARCGWTSGFARVGGDCDDTDPTIHPAAVERCDGEDNDCDGAVDLDVVFFDGDGDGFAGTEGVWAICDALPPGAATILEDCDDTSPDINPAAVELCWDELDNNCDGGLACMDRIRSIGELVCTDNWVPGRLTTSALEVCDTCDFDVRGTFWSEMDSSDGGLCGEPEDQFQLLEFVEGRLQPQDGWIIMSQQWVDGLFRIEQQRSEVLGAENDRRTMRIEIPSSEIEFDDDDDDDDEDDDDGD